MARVPACPMCRSTHVGSMIKRRKDSLIYEGSAYCCECGAHTQALMDVLNTDEPEHVWVKKEKQISQAFFDAAKALVADLQNRLWKEWEDGYVTRKEKPKKLKTINQMTPREISAHIDGMKNEDREKVIELLLTVEL